MSKVTSLKYSPDSLFRIQSAQDTSQYVSVQSGSISIGPSAPGDPAALWQFSLETGAVKNVATGLYIGYDGGITASPVPQSWTILQNPDGTYSFQSAAGTFASASSGAASLQASSGGAQTWNIVVV